MNAVLVADDLKVGLRVKVNEKRLFGHQDIAKYAREVIEGEEGELIRERMKKLKEAARSGVSDEGSSTKSLEEVVQIWNI